MDATCARCGEPLPARARFCPACAAPVQGEEAAASRRVVTVFFSDVAGSTQLGEQLDAEAVREVMNRYFGAVSSALERHGGHIEKFIGDAVVALFGVPSAHEDDALRCVRAAVEAREAVRVLGDDLHSRLGVRLGVRIGIATGEVVVGASPAARTIATGDTMNTAARLQQSAPVGEILIGAATHRLVYGSVIAEAVEPLDLKGKTDPVAAYRVVALDDDPARRLRPAATALVGRVRERQMLQAAFDRAAEERSCQLVTVLGTAGVGKSRLVAEFLAGLEPAATICAGRCLSYGEGVTYWALAEAVKALAHVDERDSPEDVRARLEALVEPGIAGEVADGVGSLLGLAGANARVEDARVALRHLFEAVAARQPLVVAFDDIHWAEPPLLDLIDDLADWLPEAPILLLCMSRPELLDERPGWSRGKLNSTTVLLEPLSEADCEALVCELLGADLPEPVAGRIVAAAEGNPLFVEELVGMLLDDGQLRRVERRRRGRRRYRTGRTPTDDPGAAFSPARPAVERRARRRRAGVDRGTGLPPGGTGGAGRRARGDPAHGADAGAQAALPLGPGRPARPGRLPIPTHPDPRGRLLSGSPRRFAPAGTRRSPTGSRRSRASGLANTRSSSGTISPRQPATGSTSATTARRRRSWHGGRPPSAGRSPTAPPRRRTSWPPRAYSAGSPHSSRPTIPPARSPSPTARAGCSQPAIWTRPPRCRTPRERLRRPAVTGRRSSSATPSGGWSRSLRAPTSASARSRRRSTAPARAPRRPSGPAASARRPGSGTSPPIWEGNTMLRCAKARAAAGRVLELGQGVRSPWLEAFGTVAGVMFLLRGRGRIPDLLRAGEERASRFGRAIRADYLADAAALLAQRGEADAAVAAVADVIAIAQELGYKAYLSQWIKGAVLLDAGRPADAIEPLELAATTAGEAGDVGSASSITGLLARALALEGHVEEAARRSTEARALSAAVDRWSALLWRGAAVRISAAQGRAAEARALADELVAILADIDYPGIEFHARLDAAEGYRAAGEREAAEALLRRAIADSDEREATEYARQAAAALERVRG